MSTPSSQLIRVSHEMLESWKHQPMGEPVVVLGVLDELLHARPATRTELLNALGRTPHPADYPHRATR